MQRKRRTRGAEKNDENEDAEDEKRNEEQGKRPALRDSRAPSPISSLGLVSAALLSHSLTRRGVKSFFLNFDFENF